MDIMQLSEKELRALNKKVVERLRFLQQARTHHIMLDFNIGEAVSFDDSGEKVFGVITRFNKKSVTVISEDQCKWNIHPSFLQKISSKPKVKDVTPAKKVIPLLSQKNAISRNSPCPCGSGKKFKRCCLN